MPDAHYKIRSKYNSVMTASRTKYDYFCILCASSSSSNIHAVRSLRGQVHMPFHCSHFRALIQQNLNPVPTLGVKPSCSEPGSSVASVIVAAFQTIVPPLLLSWASIVTVYIIRKNGENYTLHLLDSASCQKSQHALPEAFGPNERTLRSVSLHFPW